MLRPKLVAAILFAMLTVGCGDDDSVTSPGSTTDAVDNIVNSSSKSTYAHYWHVDLGSTTGTSDWAFFGDGTGTYYQSYLAPETVDFTTRILDLSDPDLRQRLRAHRDADRDKTLAKDRAARERFGGG